jgi:DNA polymerase delta subunit 4
VESQTQSFSESITSFTDLISCASDTYEFFLYAPCENKLQLKEEVEPTCSDGTDCASSTAVEIITGPTLGEAASGTIVSILLFRVIETNRRRLFSKTETCALIRTFGHKICVSAIIKTVTNFCRRLNDDQAVFNRCWIIWESLRGPVILVAMSTKKLKKSKSSSARPEAVRTKRTPSSDPVIAALAQEARVGTFGWEDLSDEEVLLRKFDLMNAFGPCIGITRMDRYQRALRMGKSPPEYILSLLQARDAHHASLFQRTM